MRFFKRIGFAGAVVLVGLAVITPGNAQTASYEYSWDNVQIVGGGYVPGIIFNEGYPDVVYARTDIGGAYRQDPFTEEWIPLLDWVGWDNWGWTGVVSVATDPQDPNRVYLAVGGYTIDWDPNPGAILRSNDMGATWDWTILDGAATGVNLPPGHLNYVQGGGIKLGGNMPGRSMGERLRIDPNNSQILYLGAPSGRGLWRSLDYGVTWKEVTSFRDAACPAQASEGCPGSYAEDPNSEFYYLHDPVGVVWITFDPNGPALDDVALDPDDPLATLNGVSGTIYVGIAENAADSIYRSDDGGVTWAAVPGQPADGFLPHHGVIDADGFLYLPYSNGAGPYDGDQGDVWRYDTNTETWALVSPVPSTDPDGNNYFGYGGVTIDASNPGTVMVSTLNSWWPDTIFWRSLDHGQTWTKVWDWTRYPKRSFRYTQDVSVSPWLDFGVPSGPGRPSAEVSPKLGWMTGDIEIDPFNPDRMMYGTGATIYGCDDLTLWDAGGQVHIRVMAQGIEETSILALASPSSGAPLVSGLGDLAGFRHDDLGVVPAESFQNPHWSTTTDLDFAELNPSYMFRVGNGSEDDGIESGAYSQDGGTSWSPVQNQPPGLTGGGSVAVSANGNRVVWAPAGTGVYYSTNNGLAWTASTGIPAGARVAADRVDPNVFYGYTGETAAGLDDATFWLSTDGGASFGAALSGGGLPSSWDSRVKAVPGHAGHVWLAGGADGLWVSTDHGADLAPLPAVDEANNVGFGLGPSGADYPAIYLQAQVLGERGIFRSDDVGLTFVRINDDQHQWGAASAAITGDPRVYGRVYLGTNGRGIVYGDCIDCPSGAGGTGGSSGGSGGSGGSTGGSGGTGGSSGGTGGAPSCSSVGDPCSADADCCSGKCKGQPGAKTCK